MNSCAASGQPGVVGCAHCSESPKGTIMNTSSWFAELEHVHSSYLLLATLAGMVLAAGVLYQIGLIGWVLRGLGMVVRGGIRQGFLLWERLLAWASWPLFLAIVFGFLVVGGVAGGSLPGLRVVCGLAPLLMGAIACLAYMFIDLERNEVERGHKAVHNPLKGQVLAMHLSAVRSAGPRPLADLRHRGLDRRVRPAQPGPL